MENKIYSYDNYDLIYTGKKEIKKNLLLVSGIYIVLEVVLALIFIVNYPTLFIVLGIILSVVYSVYFILRIIISYKRLTSYEKLLNEIYRFELDKVEVKIISKCSGFRTIDGLKFYEYRASLVSDFRKERIIFIDERVDIDLVVGEVYNCTLSNTFLVDIDEFEVKPLLCDNRINKERVIASINYNWYLYLLMIVGLVAIVPITEYYVNLPSDSEVMRIWVDRPGNLTSDDKELIHQKATEMEFKDSLIYEYYYDDTYNYSTAFSTVGLFETDIFMLIKDDDDEHFDSIEAHQESLYMDLSFVDIDGIEFYTYNDKNIGIKFRDYYIFARNSNTKTEEQIKEMIEFIISLD